jgi:hypothetical protein
VLVGLAGVRPKSNFTLVPSSGQQSTRDAGDGNKKKRLINASRKQISLGNDKERLHL